VAERAAGFRMKVLYTNPSPRPELEKKTGAERVAFDDLLASSDFVSVHVPLNDETYHLLGEREFGLMKESAYLINTSRGPVVDEAALAAALAGGSIAGAGLDVYEDEPEIAPELAGLANVVLAPHLGSATIATRTKMAAMAAENLVAALKGERPPNCVNPEVLK